MASKSISIDTEAYERLRRHKRQDETFSQTVKRILPRPVDLEELFRKVERNPLSGEAAEAIERQVRRRCRVSRGR